MTKLGKWRWYCGSDETDDEMCECSNRAEAIKYGLETMCGDVFYIVEARMLVKHEKEMADGRRDTAPFAKERNGEFIEAIKAIQQ